MLKDASKEQSAEDKQKVQDEEKAKRMADEKDSVKLNEAKKEQDQKKQQDFQDLIDGKKPMSNRQAFAQVFSEMSGAVKELKNTAQPLNSAKLSLGSFSSKLDARRQAFKAKLTRKQETEAETK